MKSMLMFFAVTLLTSSLTVSSIAQRVIAAEIVVVPSARTSASKPQTREPMAVNDVATLYLKNGDHLPGEFAEIDQDGTIAWRTDLFAVPAMFELSSLDYVVFGKTPLPKSSTQPSSNIVAPQRRGNPIIRVFDQFAKSFTQGKPAETKKEVAEEQSPIKLGSRIQLNDGTILYGEVTTLDEQWLSLQSTRHGDFRVKRSVIERIDGLSGETSAVFDALGGFQQAISIGNGPQLTDWQAANGQLTTDQVGANLFLASDHDGPVMVELIVTAKKNPFFIVSLRASKSPQYLKHAFSVETWPDRLVAHREGGDELKYVDLAAGAKTDKTIELQIYLDPTTGRMLVYSKAKLLGEFIDPDAKTSHRGFYLRNNGEDLIVKKFRGKTWNGRTTPTKPSNKHIVKLVDGQEIHGQIASITAQGMLAIHEKETSQTIDHANAADDENKDQPREVALSRIDQVVFASHEHPPKVNSDANIRVDYLDGSVVTGRYVGTTAAGLLVRVSNVPETLPLGWRNMGRVEWLTTAPENQSIAPGIIERTSYKIHGRVVGAGADGQVLWHPYGSSKPLPLNLESKAKVSFNSVAAAKIDASLTDEMHLTNGDTVPCRLLSIDSEFVHVQFADGTNGRVKRDVFKGIRRRPQESYVYQGFQPDEAWHVSTNQQSAISLKDGVLELKKLAFLSKDVHLPARACISFDAEWTGDCTLYLGFGADSAYEAARRRDPNMGYSTKMMEAEAKRPRDFYAEVAITRLGKAITAQGYLRSSGLVGQAFMNNNRVIVSTQARSRNSSLAIRDESTVNVDVFADRPRKQYAVVANGKTLATWKESARVDGGAIYLGFASQQSSQPNFGLGTVIKQSAKSKPGYVRVSNLRVARWPGAIPDDRMERLLTRRLGARPKATTHVLRAFNGDSLRGQLVGVANNTVTFKVRLDNITIPLDKVAEIIALRDDKDEEIGKEPFSLELHDGGSIAMTPVQVTDELMVGDSPSIGRIAVPWKVVSQLNIGNSFQRSLSNLISWTLREPAPLPDLSGSGGGSSSVESPMVGNPAPEIRLTMLDGTEKKLSDLQGKTVILDFWATWCGPCVASLPKIMEVATEHDEDVILIAVNQQEDSETVTEFLAAHEWNDLTVALDDDTVAGRTYRVEGIPHTVIIDADGIVRNVHVGASPSLKEELTKEIEAALEDD